VVSGTQYVMVWEFRVRQEKAAEFVQKYGPEGAWARFFRGSAGYIKTELVRDVASDLRFLTLDYWQTEEEFSRFKQQHLAEYERLDQEFEGLTEQETRLGTFYRTIES
jgi:heme-degrading monooxygenase HmoA